MKRTIIIAAVAAVFFQCSSDERHIERILREYHRHPVNSGCTINYPLDGTLFPPEIISPVLQWDDSVAAQWLVSVTCRSRPAYRIHRLVTVARWQPEDTLWETIKNRSMNDTATLLVIGIGDAAPHTILSAATATFGTSPDSVSDRIFYREVTLPFGDAVKDPSDIRWRCGSIAQKKAPVVLENLLVCGNCHSFSANGGILGMDVDYANDKGSYAVTSVKARMTLDSADIISWSDYKRNEKDPTFGLLSQISPDGRYVVSTVKDRSVFVPVPDLAFSQLFFPIKGILVVYERATGAFTPLAGASDPAFVQSNAVWSPDQRHILFARSAVHRLALDDKKKIRLTREECHEFLVEKKKFLFDLYRVPFNNGRGGRAEPLPGASNNGMSNFFPRYSPDGRWIVFCKASSYMLLQPDSRLYIMPARGGDPRPMRCNTDRMNSWHSWSSNGRWLVFASKKYSPYTQLFLTHINEQGEDSPPVLLDFLTSPDRAANIPEFVHAQAGAIDRIEQRFVDDLSYWRSGKAFEEAGDFVSAEKRYATAVSMNPRNRDAHISLGNMQELQDKLPEALAQYRAAAVIDSQSALAQINLGNLYKRLDRFDEAVAAYTKALALEPRNRDAHFNIGHLYEALERFNPALSHLQRVITFDADDIRGRYLLGLTYDKMGNSAKALAAYRVVVRSEPNHVAALRIQAAAAEKNGRFNEAIDRYAVALQKEPRNPIWYCLQADLLVRQGRNQEAAAGYAKALEIHPVYSRAREGLDNLSRESGDTIKKGNR
ncbi:MAG: tetratricopeptide repeat protein [Chitinispirillaceae bacterium]|nr:tetratricopeptide repeat protein [Chitinispirillaceae bacterium]